jgi:hypothetical protein
MISEHHCSMVDVQHLPGHNDLSTTQEYVELSPAHEALVHNLWGKWDMPDDEPRQVPAPLRVRQADLAPAARPRSNDPRDPSRESATA